MEIANLNTMHNCALLSHNLFRILQLNISIPRSPNSNGGLNLITKMLDDQYENPASINDFLI